MQFMKSHHDTIILDHHGKGRKGRKEITYVRTYVTTLWTSRLAHCGTAHIHICMYVHDSIVDRQAI